MISRQCLAAVFTLIAGTAANGQATERQVVEVKSHSFGMSWALFAACDDNGDDRLDVFEASASFLGVDATEPGSFRKLDLDADGKLHWDEFDARFRASLYSAKSFSVRVSRAVQKPIDPTGSDTVESREEIFVRLADSNHDTRISQRELLDFADKAELEPAPDFALLDKDLSGQLSAAEFAALLGSLPNGGETLIRRYQSDPKTLPREYQRADLSRDGTIDGAELTEALAAIDPSLRRWSDRILKDADYSGNGRLDRAEIQRAVRSNDALRNMALPTETVGGAETQNK